MISCLRMRSTSTGNLTWLTISRDRGRWLPDKDRPRFGKLRDGRLCARCESGKSPEPELPTEIKINGMELIKLFIILIDECNILKNSWSLDSKLLTKNDYLGKVFLRHFICGDEWGNWKDWLKTLVFGNFSLKQIWFVDSWQRISI